MIALYYDYTSLASLAAYVDVFAIADRLNLSGHVAPIGIDVLSLSSSIPATLDQHDDYERYHAPLCAQGFTLHRPQLRPPTFPAHVVADNIDDQALRRTWDMHVFTAYWHQNVDIGDHAWLADSWREIGGRARIEPMLTDSHRHQHLRRRMAADRHRGIGGVPVLDAAGTLVPALQTVDDLESVLLTFAT